MATGGTFNVNRNFLNLGGVVDLSGGGAFNLTGGASAELFALTA